MTLSYQLTRGTVALALIVALAMTALTAPAVPAATRTVLITRAVSAIDAPAVHAVCALPPPALRLALAPGDLGAFARRHDDDCRA